MPTSDRRQARPTALPGCTVLPPIKPDRGEAEAKGKDRRCRGSSERFAVLNSFVDFALAGLTGAEVKVWVILFRDTKAATGTARTGQADIARRAGLSVRGARKAIAGLERKGLLIVRYRGRLNGGPSVYRVSPSPPAI
jgi:hypothetical protein